MRPIIGITCDREIKKGGNDLHQLRHDCVSAVWAGGGLPLLLPSTSEEGMMRGYMGIIDGLIISGGAHDLSPSLYSEEPHSKLGPLNPARESCELSLTEMAHKKGMPILGICGGMQLLNVWSGGDLYQDIGSQCPGAIDHKPKIPSTNPAHRVRVERGTRLHRLIGMDEIEVNSTHHQAARRVSGGFIASAFAEDGIIEAIELKDDERLILGVQWHPERLVDWDKASQRLIRGFIQEVSRYTTRLA